MIKIVALVDFGDDEHKVVSDEGVTKGTELLVNEEQARVLIAMESAERAADQESDVQKKRRLRVPKQSDESAQ